MLLPLANFGLIVPLKLRPKIHKCFLPKMEWMQMGKRLKVDKWWLVFHYVQVVGWCHLYCRCWILVHCLILTSILVDVLQPVFPQFSSYTCCRRESLVINGTGQPVWRYASAVLAVIWCLCLSQVTVLLKRPDILSWFLAQMLFWLSYTVLQRKLGTSKIMVLPSEFQCLDLENFAMARRLPQLVLILAPQREVLSVINWTVVGQTGMCVDVVTL